MRLTAYPRARREAFKPETILNSFAAAGIAPFDPNRVISKLNIRLITPPPPPSRGSDSSRNFTPKTPYTVKDVRRQASSIKKMLQEDPSRAEKAFEQIVKGCHLAIHGATIMRHENRELRAANAKTTQKRKRTRKRIAHKGGISVLEAMSIVSGPEIVHEASSGRDGAVSPTPNRTNKRRPQRCSLCKNLGHRRNRCPEMSE